MIAFLAIPVPSIIALFLLALGLNGLSENSWQYVAAAIAMMLALLLSCLWVLWLGVVLIAKLNFGHPFKRPGTAIVFVALPALAFMTMLLTWRSANEVDGSILFEFAALLFGAWCFWAARTALRNLDERLHARKTFTVVPAISLLVVLGAVLAAAFADQQAWRSVPGFIWSFLFVAGVLTYAFWAAWAWRVLPRRLHPVFAPTLIFLAVGIFFGPELFALMLALLVTVTVPIALSRAATLERPPIVKPSIG